MSRSPLAYLRGSAQLFYEALVREPWLAAGPRGEGVLVGDLHLENFGAYRVDDDDVVFDLNDFDEAVFGPFDLDVLRLVTSLILGGRTMGFDGRRALDLARHMLDEYTRVAMQGAPVAAAPVPIAALVAKVRARSKHALVNARTEVTKKGKRRFVRGERYVDLPKPMAKAAKRAFLTYAHALVPRPEEASLRIVDMAFRIAGTGSLGSLRIAVLTQNKGSDDPPWIFDMKEQDAPSPVALLGPKCAGDVAPATRVCGAMLACLERSPKQSGITKLGARSMFARLLSPQEDKLDLRRIEPEHLEPLSRYLGGLLGRAHARGATKMPKTAWSPSQCAGILERATVLAGLHEAAYLAMCRRL